MPTKKVQDIERLRSGGRFVYFEDGSRVYEGSRRYNDKIYSVKKREERLKKAKKVFNLEDDSFKLVQKIANYMKVRKSSTASLEDSKIVLEITD